MNFYDAAVMAAGIGWKIFPLVPGSKKPLTQHGVHDASDDEEVIGEWARRCPNANIGVACGAANNILALDVDKHHAGVETLKSLQDKHGALPKAPMAKTPRGGFHLYFAHHPKPISGANRCGKGLDIKTDGGYLVFPPSFWNGRNGKKTEMENGGFYRWLRAPRGPVLPDMPPWLVKLASPKPLPPLPKRRLDPNISDQRIRECCNRIATSMNGARNDTLNKLSLRAFILAIDAGHAPESLVEDLVAAGCAVERDRKAVRNTVMSALKGARKLHFHSAGGINGVW